MADKFTNDRAWSSITFGAAAVTFTPADADLPVNVKAVVFDADGTISFKNAGDASATAGYPVIKGMPMMFVPARITAMTGPTTCFLIK